jgi:rod shape-determining protein MreD
VNPVKTAALIAGAVLLEVQLFSWFSFGGARPEIVILLVLAVGYLVGPDQGAIVGFAAGLALDVFLTTPLGFSAFVYTVAGYAIGQVSPSLVRSAWWIGALVVAGASGLTMLATAIFGEVLGLDTLHGPAVGTIVTVVALVNLVFAPLALRLVGWARLGDPTRRRRSVFA